jgi:hypothetical protein
MRVRRPNQRNGHLARRALLNGLLLGGATSAIPWRLAEGADAGPARAIGAPAKVTPADIERIAGLLYGIACPPAMPKRSPRSPRARSPTCTI